MLVHISGLYRFGRRSNVHSTAMILPPFCVLALGVLGAIIAQSSPAAAAGGVCSLKSMGSFGNTVVDIVANATASATSQVEYDCNSPTKFNSIQFCTYIQAADANPANSQENNTFYQMRDTNSHIAWQMKLSASGDMPVANFGSSQATAGWTHYTNWSPTKQSTIASQQLTLTYLDRQQQDRVRSGGYNNAYQLVTQYKFNNDVASTCSNGLANPDGTIISNFNAIATVTKNCQMENFQDIDFGTQNGLEITSENANQLRSYGNVGIRCTYETPYNISIDAGMNAENGIARLKSDNNFLPYKLLQQGCKTTWDDKSTLSGNGNTVNAINNHQVCAQIITPLARAPAAGTYTDTVIVTATF